jgi:hypothetical protein
MKSDDIPVLTRYSPLLLEADLPDQIILKNNNPIRNYILIIALLELINYINSLSLFHIIFSIFLIFVFIASFFIEDPRIIIVSSVGVTLVHKFLFCRFKFFLSRDNMRSISIFIKKRKFGGYIGHIRIHCLSSRSKNIIKLSRRTQHELLEDLNEISDKLSNILSISKVKRS